MADPTGTDLSATDLTAAGPSATDPSATDPSATDPSATDPSATDPSTPELTEPARLVWPTIAVRESYLSGERIHRLTYGWPTEALDEAEADFAAYVARRRGVHIRWEVPTTVYWYVSGQHYLGTLVLRHRLTRRLAEAGGHIGYHIVTPWQRRGHATRMLTAGLVECHRLGLDRVLLSCDPDNEASRRVILANGGVPDGRQRGEDRFWITLAADHQPR